SDAEAERLARPAYKRWFDSLAWLWIERGSFPPISISADYDQSKAAGTLVVGNPDTVGRILTAQAERIRQNYLLLMLAFRSLAHPRAGNALARAIQKRNHAEARGDELRRGFACAGAGDGITHDATRVRDALS